MKRLVLFAVLFFGYSIDVCDAYGTWYGDCDVLVTSITQFSCQDGSVCEDCELRNGQRAQILGTVECGPVTLTTRSLICEDSGSDGWRDAGTVWMSSSVHNNATDPNALYYLYESDERTMVNNPPVPYNSSTSYYAKEGKVKAVCREGYVSNESRCVEIKDYVECYPSNAHHDGSGNCTTDDGTNCLKVSNNMSVYCHSDDFYRINKVDASKKKNSCSYRDEYMFVVSEKPTKYFRCDADSQWKENTFPRCTGIDKVDEFTSGCGNVANCEDKVLQVASTGHSIEVPKTSLTWTKIKPVSDATYCIISVCKAGYTKSGNNCVSEEEAGCIDSLGEWNAADQKCTCDPAKKLLQNGNFACRCETGWNIDTVQGKCVLVNAELKEQKCKESHGDWANDKCSCDSGKGLKTANYNGFDECVCEKEQGYERYYNIDEKKCVITDMEQKRKTCKEADYTTWDPETKQCICTESGKIWTNNQCVWSADYNKCLTVKTAHWDSEKDKCVCKDKGQELNSDWQCVDTPETIAKKEIKDSFPKFNALVSTLDVNKWKNQDGKFNVARLASDSIAGVVLGTVGGLVTSKVVKKNQVKKGFENIRCVIGGQIVADYGDEFMVGSK